MPKRISKDDIVKLKSRYDKARTTYEISKSKRDEVIKSMKEYGVTPENIDDKIASLKKDIDKKEKNINKTLNKIDETLTEIK